MSTAWSAASALAAGGFSRASSGRGAGTAGSTSMTLSAYALGGSTQTPCGGRARHQRRTVTTDGSMPAQPETRAVDAGEGLTLGTEGASHPGTRSGWTEWPAASALPRRRRAGRRPPSPPLPKGRRPAGAAHRSVRARDPSAPGAAVPLAFWRGRCSGGAAPRAYLPDQAQDVERSSTQGKHRRRLGNADNVFEGAGLLHGRQA